MRSALTFIVLSLAFEACATTRAGAPTTDVRAYQGPPTAAAITPGDLKTRLYIFADDSMRGRAAGTPDNLRGTAYIEREVRRLGLEPGGNDGTYFQDIAFISRTVASRSSLTVNGKPFALGNDFIPRDNGPGMRPLDGAPAVYGGVWGDSSSLISASAAEGKVVVVTLPTGWAVSRATATRRFATAAGIAVVTADRIPASSRAGLLEEKNLDLAEEAPSIGRPVPTFLYVSNALAAALFNGSPVTGLKSGATGGTIGGQVSFDTGHPSPGRNVIAIIRGSDPALRGEFVALGAHNDHEPPEAAVDHDSLRAFNAVVRPEGAESPASVTVTSEQRARIRGILDSLRRIRPPRLDSIMNGADDDGTGSMALLEIAEAFARSNVKPKRSILFVWHTGEELGLVGSDYFTRHPTVPRDSIVTQLNIDMIGRGGSNDAVHDVNNHLTYGNPDFVEVIGSRRLSTELGDIVDAVNQKQSRPLAFSRVFDVTGERHQMYCRSDHYMYARFGIPITFFFTSVHRDYHQVTDEPQYIDYIHYARIVNLVHDIAEQVANLDHRIVVDKPKPDPTGRCQA